MMVRSTKRERCPYCASRNVRYEYLAPALAGRRGGEDVRDDSETEFHLPGMLAAFRRGRVINKNSMGWDQVLNLDI